MTVLAARLVIALALEFLFALAGFIVFYGLERLALVPTGRASPAPGAAPGNELVFWVRLGAFSLYNTLIGYLLVPAASSSVPRGAAAGSGNLRQMVIGSVPGFLH